jgi:predicted O-linked N-acetylglucosamine transferase (SPINDLY family)
MAQLTLQQAFDLALQHHQAARNDLAADVFRQIIAHDPNSVEAHVNLGNVLTMSRQLDEAIAAYRRAIALRPDLPEVHSNLGNALRDKGQFNEAIAACRQALLLRPSYAEAYNNLGNALSDQRLIDEAISAYRQAIAIRPDYADAHRNLGNALKIKGELDAAIFAYRQATALRPNHAESYNDLGNALKDVGQIDAALVAYRHAILLEPNHAMAHSNLVLTMEYDGRSDAAAIARERAAWNRQHAQPLIRFVRPHTNDRDPERRLRIGYVSPDFRDHVVGRNILPLFCRHDRGQFEIFCYSQSARPDAMTAEFQKHADRWCDITGLSDDSVAEKICADSIDILVDIALHLANNRLLVFARKPAPVQVSFAGYPSSSGLTSIDYRLSDPYLDPVGADETIHSERTIRLPGSFWCYDPLECGDIGVGPLPAQGSGVLTFGCLNNVCKINDEVLALWSQVLRKAEKSRLLLLAPLGNCRQRMLDRFGREEIDPGRIEFVAMQPRRKFLETFHRIDVGLDTFPYNGHTTSLESLWMGVPVVTWVGNRSVGRAGWSQLSNLRLGELAGRTPEQFVEIAVGLARDLPRLQQIRSTLRGRMENSPLMDATGFARHIEAVYRGMWQNWCEGGE